MTNSKPSGIIFWRFLLMLNEYVPKKTRIHMEIMFIKINRRLILLSSIPPHILTKNNRRKVSNTSVVSREWWIVCPDERRYGPESKPRIVWICGNARRIAEQNIHKKQEKTITLPDNTRVTFRTDGQVRIADRTLSRKASLTLLRALAVEYNYLDDEAVNV